MRKLAGGNILPRVRFTPLSLKVFSIQGMLRGLKWQASFGAPLGSTPLPSRISSSTSAMAVSMASLSQPRPVLKADSMQMPMSASSLPVRG